MNEAQNIGHVLEPLPDDLHEVILVDGNSEDDTIEAARAAYPEIRVLVQSGRGKGDAFRTGFAAVTGNLVVMLDADGSADPAEIPRFVEALEAGADFAKGSRFLPGGGSTDITGLRSLGNSVLSGTANLLHGTHFTDLCYGYNAFWARCLPFIALDVPGLRGRDADQPAHRRRRDEDHRGAELRARPHLTARATSTPSATASACSARSSARRGAGANSSGGNRGRRCRPGRRRPRTTSAA